jgi:alpha-beta hydrolase superfamily lysophospholipase
MTATTERDSFATSDGLQLFTRHWEPDASPEAAVVLVHGYAEHSGRYDHVAEVFVEQGAAVYAYDQRGYGRSEGRRAYVDDFDRYLDDLGQFLDRVRARHPDRPLFLFGHSMGGLVVLKYVLDREPSVQGLLLSGPAIEINPDLAPLLRRVAQVLGRLFPTLPTTRSPEDAISRDPEVVEEAKNDPLNYHGRVLARTGAEMLRAGDAVRARLEEVTDPFLVLHGTADTLASPEWSRRLYERAASPDKTIQLYDGLYHETFNEPERATVLSDMGEWIGDRLP